MKEKDQYEKECNMWNRIFEFFKQETSLLVSNVKWLGPNTTFADISINFLKR